MGVFVLIFFFIKIKHMGQYSYDDDDDIYFRLSEAHVAALWGFRAKQMDVPLLWGASE